VAGQWFYPDITPVLSVTCVMSVVLS
jgi:hypothetical protein